MCIDFAATEKLKRIVSENILLCLYESVMNPPHYL